MFNFAFFSFICLFHCHFMPTNAYMVNFSIKRLSDSKILKIWFCILKLKIRRPIKYSDPSGRVHQLMIRVTVLGISIQSFLLRVTSRIRFHRPPLGIYFFMFYWCLYNYHKSFIIVCLKCQLIIFYLKSL